MGKKSKKIKQQIPPPGESFQKKQFKKFMLKSEINSIPLGSPVDDESPLDLTDLEFVGLEEDVPPKKKKRTSLFPKPQKITKGDDNQPIHPYAPQATKYKWTRVDASYQAPTPMCGIVPIHVTRVALNNQESLMHSNSQNMPFKSVGIENTALPMDDRSLGMIMNPGYTGMSMDHGMYLNPGYTRMSMDHGMYANPGYTRMSMDSGNVNPENMGMPMQPRNFGMFVPCRNMEPMYAEVQRDYTGPSPYESVSAMRWAGRSNSNLTYEYYMEHAKACLTGDHAKWL